MLTCEEIAAATSDSPRELHPMDAHDLFRALDRFFTENRHHRSVEYRWLAQQAIDLKNKAHDLWANGVVSFEQRNHDAIAALRLAEIDEEREKIAKADAKLAAEAKKLRPTGFQ